MRDNDQHCLDVYLHDRLVGQLQSHRGTLRFRYLSTYLQDPHALKLSAALPLSDVIFEHASVSPFFSGLLPDEGVRHRLAAYLGLSEKNTFGLLKAIGGECAGAISLHAPGCTPQAQDAHASYRTLSEDEADDLLSHLEKTPMLADEDGVRLSGAGAQDKLMIAFVGGQIAIPMHTAPSTHIIKPPIAHCHDSVFNEFFCMRLATAVGISAPPTSIHWVKDKAYYVVKRYDRIMEGDQRIVRLHQEDFCQALGIPPEIKYENEGGPGLLDCVGFLDHRIQAGHMPAVSRLMFLRSIMFHVIIGNSDAHAKNFSIIYEADSERLSPMYDALSTMVYAHPSKVRLAMKIAGQKRFEHISLSHWITLGESIGFKEAFIVQEWHNLQEKVRAASLQLMSELNADMHTASPIYESINRIIQRAMCV